MENMIAGGFGLVLGVALIAAGAYQIRNRSTLRTWKTTTGKVVERGTFRISHATRSPSAFHHSPLVRYRYSVGGQEFVNDAILPRHIQLSEHSTVEWASERASVFPDEVTVYFNPEDHGDSFLVIPSKAKLFLILGGGLLVCLVAVAFILI